MVPSGVTDGDTLFLSGDGFDFSFFFFILLSLFGGVNFYLF